MRGAAGSRKKIKKLQAEHQDEELIELLRKDGDRAMELLFQRYYAYLCRSAYRVLADSVLVEDLVQEVFYELWKRRGDLRITTSLKAYLRRATVNKTLNYIRDHRKVRFEQEEEVTLSAQRPGAAQRLEAAELQQLIDRSIDALPERCRIVFILSRFEDMTYKEIAGQLGISEKTVENQISKALRLLREALGPYLMQGLFLFFTGWW